MANRKLWQALALLVAVSVVGATAALAAGAELRTTSQFGCEVDPNG